MSQVNQSPDLATGSSESPRPALASELIAHLESGGLLATGDPDHIMFLRYEIYEWRGKIQKHLGAYGWGSALGTVESKLMSVLNDPFEWVMVSNNCEGHRGETEAKAALEKIGRWVDYEWELTVAETRRPNVDYTPVASEQKG